MASIPTKATGARGWVSALAAVALLLGARVLAPNETAAEIAFLMAPALAVGLLAMRAWRSPAGGPTGWGILTLGVGCLFAAEAYWFAQDLLEIETYPSPGEYLNAAALVLIALGLWRTVTRVAPVGDRTGIIDSTAVALAAATLGWLLVVEPASSHGEMSGDEQTWVSLLVGLDVAILAVLARLGFSLRVRPPAYLFIYLAAGGLVALDGGESMLELSADVELGLEGDLLMMLAYSCWGLAAQRSDHVERAVASALRYVGTRRIAILGASALVPLAASTLQQLRGVTPTTTTLWVVGGAGLAIGALVMVRLAGLVGTVRRVADERGRDRFAALVEHSSDVIVTVDREANVTYCSPAIEAVWGHDPEGLVGRAFNSLFAEDSTSAASDHLARTAALSPHATLAFESNIRRADGTTRTCEAVAANLLDDAGVAALVVTMRDITDRKALESELRHQAFRDSLTGLANRALFLDRVEHALARRRQAPGSDVVVLFVDLDGFKQVNDGLGHTAGDEILTAVGSRLRLCVHAADTVARLGGDEFAVLLEDRDGPADAVTATERVLSVFEAPLRAAGIDLSIQASIGVALARTGDSAEDLIEHADVAMYEAKGSDACAFQLFDPEMKKVAAERIALRSDLEHALELKQFRVVYQPILDIRTRRFKGAEALVRWNHPIRGNVSPENFIPIAEQTGLIRDLGQWILECACADAARWQQSGPGTTVNVNVSAIQLRNHHLVERVLAALDRASLDPSLLILEVTETAMMADADATARVLDGLRALGVRVAIDDFGTGYCSLAYLKRFAVDLLKIDRAFVSEIKRDSERLLAHHILELAHNLGIATVAEGIEELSQLENLGEHGCDFGQGFHLGRPMDAETFQVLAGRTWRNPDA